MTFLRSLCSVIFVVLFFSGTAPVIQCASYDIAAQRTEQLPPQVTTTVSPDGHTLAIARSSGGFEKRNGRVELWDLTSGALQRIITGFDGPIWSISFSKNNRSLITVSTEFRKLKTQPSDRINQDPKTAELKWWDVNSGEFQRKVSLGSEGILSVQASWSPAGDVLALVERYPRGHYVPIVRAQSVYSEFVSSVELKLGLFDAHSLETRTKIEGGQQTTTGETTFLARMAFPVFSSNGDLLAAVSGTDVKIWKVDSGKKFRTIREFNGDPTAIAFSPNGQLIAVAAVKRNVQGGRSEINVLEMSTGRLLNTLKLPNDLVASLQFAAARDRTLLIGTLQYEAERAVGTVKIWNVIDKRFFRFEVTEGKTVSSMTVIPNSRAIVLQSGSDVEVRDLNTWRVIHSFDPSAEDASESTRRSPFLLSANRALAVAFLSDGITVSSVLPREIRTWDSRTGGVKNRLSRETVLDEVLATSSNGDLFAEATTKEVRLIEVRTGTNKTLALQTGPISAIALAADGRSLVTADEHGSVQFWEVGTSRLTKSFETGREITAIAVDTSGNVLAAATADGSIGLWSVPAGTLKQELKKHRNVVTALAFSPDGRMLASGDEDRNLILWELASGKATRTFEKPELTVSSIAFSPDAQLLATGTGNESVLLWNVRTGRLEGILR